MNNLENWYSNSKIFRWNGHAIAYKVHEVDKPWLLLIHGFPTASYDWRKIWDTLSANYSLIAPDMLGFGYSDKPKDFPYSIMMQADLITDLMDHVGITKCHILAHDYGDTVTQELIARFNETKGMEIETVCLLNGGIFPESHHPLRIQKLLMSPIGVVLSRLLNQKKFEKSFSSIFGPETPISKEELELYWQLVSRENGHRIAHLIIRYMRERVVHRERWVGALQHYSQPLALINGLADPISGQVMVDRYRQIISDKNIFEIPNIGHYPQLESAKEVLNCYLKWRGSD